MPSSLEFRKTDFSGLYTLTRRVATDERGFFFRMFCASEMKEIGLIKPLSQINLSHASCLSTTRGLHYQKPPHTETKIVTCIKGKIFDVAVDLRRNSPTFLRWFGTILSEENCTSVIIPDGFAHGTQSLTDESELIYLHTEPYSSQFEAGLNVTDPLLNIAWPAPPLNLSKRDASFPTLNRDFEGLNIA